MKTKRYYYVGVQTGSGLSLVTKRDYTNKMAWWNAEQKPMKMPQSTARDLAWALCVNGFEAVVIDSLIDFETQPFLR